MIGNDDLSSEKLNEILSTCINIEVLSLRNLTKLANIDFVKKMPALKELDLFGCTNLTNLKVLDDLTSVNKLSLKTLRIDNTSIDLSQIQNTISKLDYDYAPSRLGFLISWSGCSGFYATANVWKNLTKCDKITNITGCYYGNPEIFDGEEIDLTSCSSLKTFRY